MKSNSFEAWRARIDFFGKEFGFGPIKRVCNEDGRLHADNKPAYVSPTRVIWYQNGRKHGLDADVHGSIHYYYEGIRVPPHYITKPDTLQIAAVLAEKNAEVRYAGVKIFGLDRILSGEKTGAAKPVIIDTDKSSGMVLFKFAGVFSDTDMYYLKVINSTAEPDGTFKTYFLCVPPTMKKCKEAVAWTFGLSPKEYKPLQES